MKQITNHSLLMHYFNAVHFNSYFDHDMSDITELFFFEPGEYIIHEGVIPTHIFFLVDGRAKLFALTDSGKVAPFGSSREFSVFGEIASLWKMMPSSSVQAAEKCYCLGIHLKKYRRLLLDDNQFLRFISRTMSRRITMQNGNMISYLSCSAEKKVAAFIIQNSADNMLQPSLKACAEDLGISCRQLIRVMNSFLQKNYLKKVKRRYYIMDYDALYNLGSDTYSYLD